jgi:hypothetical protein
VPRQFWPSSLPVLVLAPRQVPRQVLVPGSSPVVSLALAQSSAQVQDRALLRCCAQPVPCADPGSTPGIATGVCSLDGDGSWQLPPSSSACRQRVEVRRRLVSTSSSQCWCTGTADASPAETPSSSPSVTGASPSSSPAHCRRVNRGSSPSSGPGGSPSAGPSASPSGGPSASPVLRCIAQCRTGCVSQFGP